MFRCPRCEESFDWLNASLVSTFKARCYTQIRESKATFVIERVAVNQLPPTVDSLSCPECGNTAPEDEWAIIVQCYRCGTELASDTKEAVEKVIKKYYCADLGGVLCYKDYDKRYGGSYCKDCTYSRNCILGRRGRKRK